MGDVIRFPGHKWAHCKNQECTGCGLCTGGLGVCVSCGGMEGSLPTDCPGRPMSDVTEHEVYVGRLDYRRRRGWVKETSVNSPAYFRGAS